MSSSGYRAGDPDSKLARFRVIGKSDTYWFLMSKALPGVKRHEFQVLWPWADQSPGQPAAAECNPHATSFAVRDTSKPSLYVLLSFLIPLPLFAFYFFSIWLHLLQVPQLLHHPRYQYSFWQIIWQIKWFGLEHTLGWKLFPCDFNACNSSSGDHSVIHLMLSQRHGNSSSQDSVYFNTVTAYYLHLSFTHVFIIFIRQITIIEIILRCWINFNTL